MRVFRVLMIGMVWGGLAGSAAGIEFDTPIVIVNAKIVAGPGEMIESGSVLIDQGRIVAYGAVLAVPADAETIDANGLIVYPGFIDASTHAGITQAKPDAKARARVEGETPDEKDGPYSATLQAYRLLVHPHWRAEELYDGKAGKAEDFRKAGFTTALVCPQPAIFSGRSAVIEMGDAPLRRSIVKARFGQHVGFVTTRGDDRFDLPRYPTAVMGTMATIRQALLDARWHRELGAWADRHTQATRPAVDRDLEALAALINGALPAVFVANTENEIHRALNLAKEFGLRPVIAGGREGWKVADRLKREKVEVILSLKWPEEPKRDEKKDGSKAKAKEKEGEGKGDESISPSKDAARKKDSRPLFDEAWEKRRFEPMRLFEERVRLWAEQVDNAKRLDEAGVAFALGSFEMKSPEELIKHLRKAVERGLSEEAALAGLTRNAAAVLGLSDQLGAIAPGRLANLTVMTEAWTNEKAKIEWVFVEGKRFDLGGSSKGKDDKKDKKEGERGEGEEKSGGAESQPASQPTTNAVTQPASQPTTQPANEPVFRVEIEADRKPRLRTGGNVLIKNATLLTVSDGDVTGKDLLIRDGKIANIGKNLVAGEGTTTLDLTGYVVVPGMIDPHSHLCIEGGVNEYSLSVTCEVRIKDVVNHRDVGAFRALAGGVTTIHTMHGSANAMGGQNAVLRLKYGKPAAEWIFREAPQTVKFALGENVKRSNWGKRGSRFPNTRMGVEAVMRRSFDAAERYEAARADYEKSKADGGDPRPLRRDLRLDALTDILRTDIWVHTHCYRADEILRLLSVAEDYGFRIRVLQHILEGYRVIPEMRRHGCGASTFSDWWGYKIEAYDAIPQNAARMVQGGIMATINSDSPELVRHLYLEAAKSMRFGGLSPNDALRLVTLNGAIQLGIEDRVGSIEIGKDGDLAVFNGHPLDTFSKCALTFIEGEVYFQDDSFDAAEPLAAHPVKRFGGVAGLKKIERNASGEYWIVGGAVHPVTGDRIDNGTVAIQGGKVVYVGSAGGKKPPAGATVIDAKGLHVWPGLINAGTVLGLIEIPSVPGSVDVSTIGSFQPDLLALSAYNPFSAAVEVSRSEGVTTALVLPGGATVSGQAGLVHLDGWSMPEARIASRLGLRVDLPSLPTKFPDDLAEDKKKKRIEEHRKTLAKIERFFRTAGHYAKVHALAAGDPQLKPASDRRLDAMVPYMRAEKSVLFDADSYKEIKEALRFAERYDLRPIILGGQEAWKLADEIADKKIDVILTGSMTLPDSESEPWDSVYRNAAELDGAGVRFCITTGGTRPGLEKLLGVEAGMAVAHGLDADRAVESITIDAARILGLDDRLGSLKVGKVADVIVTTDNLMQAANVVVASFIAGRPVDLSNKHTRLDEKFRSRPEPTFEPVPVLRGPPAISLPRVGQ